MNYKNTQKDSINYSSQLNFEALIKSVIVTLILIASIYFGSKKLEHFDFALIGYTFGCISACLGVCYRYFVWLSKPPTKKYWVRSRNYALNPKYWINLKIPKILISNFTSKIVVQKFIYVRSKRRWLAHILIAWGCMLAASITFPLVLGWIHFGQGEILPEPTMIAYLFWFPTAHLKLHGIFSWLVFHVLVISSFMVIAGVIISLYRRMSEGGTKAVQRFGRDLLPLIMLFLVSFSGLLLWVNYEWFDGFYYAPLAQFHAITVIATLLYLPFGKLFHIFQRFASIGVFLYKNINSTQEQAKCPVTKENFTSKSHVEDLKDVLHDLDFNYQSKSGRSYEWNELSPKGRRMIIGKAHSKIKNGKF